MDGKILADQPLIPPAQDVLQPRNCVIDRAMQAREFMKLDVMVLSILLYALLGKLADMIARGLETRGRVRGRNPCCDLHQWPGGLMTFSTG